MSKDIKNLVNQMVDDIGSKKLEREDYRDEKGKVPGEQDTGPHEYEEKRKKDKDYDKVFQNMLRKHGLKSGEELGNLSDEKTKEFFNDLDRAWKAEKEKKKEEAHYEKMSLMVYEQIHRMQNQHDVMYSGQVRELKNDLLSFGYTYEMCRRIMKNKVYLGEATDPEDIEVENPGILEVPEGKDVESLPASHFINLAKKKGREEIVRALLNLWRWNHGKGGEKGELARWAKDMQEKVSKEMEKEEKE